MFALGPAHDLEGLVQFFGEVGWDCPLGQVRLRGLAPVKFHAEKCAAGATRLAGVRSHLIGTFVSKYRANADG